MQLQITPRTLRMIDMTAEDAERQQRKAVYRAGVVLRGNGYQRRHCHEPGNQGMRWYAPSHRRDAPESTVCTTDVLGAAIAEGYVVDDYTTIIARKTKQRQKDKGEHAVLKAQELGPWRVTASHPFLFTARGKSKQPNCRYVTLLIMHIPLDYTLHCECYDVTQTTGRERMIEDMVAVFNVHNLLSFFVHQPAELKSTAIKLFDALLQQRALSITNKEQTNAD